MKFRAPNWSSGPHRPQLESRSWRIRTSSVLRGFRGTTTEYRQGVRRGGGGRPADRTTKTADQSTMTTPGVASFGIEELPKRSRCPWEDRCLTWEADRRARGCPKSGSGQRGQMHPGCLVERGSPRHGAHVPRGMPATARSVSGRGRYCVPTHPGDPRSRHTGWESIRRQAARRCGPKVPNWCGESRRSGPQSASSSSDPSALTDPCSEILVNGSIPSSTASSRDARWKRRAVSANMSRSASSDASERRACTCDPLEMVDAPRDC